MRHHGSRGTSRGRSRKRRRRRRACSGNSCPVDSSHLHPHQARRDIAKASTTCQITLSKPPGIAAPCPALPPPNPRACQYLKLKNTPPPPRSLDFPQIRVFYIVSISFEAKKNKKRESMKTRNINRVAATLSHRTAHTLRDNMALGAEIFTCIQTNNLAQSCNP